ncbi:MAG: asparagine synthase C-terminal domain-containing protein [Candidatus Thermoplasmatota archaeon]|nr:asparagine synthase C-terminal domain-containing protein [Candidatus Thermoplasmatota archaeon]
MLSFWIDRLNFILTKTVSALDKKRKGILFSGGLDSSILAFLVSKHAEVVLYVAGIEGAYDIDVARKSAQLLNLQLIEIFLTEKDIEEALPIISKIVISKNPIEISYLLPLFFVAKHSREKELLSAYGADELFAGYAKYLRSENLEEELKKDLLSLKEKGMPSAQKIASYFNKELKAPFLELEIIELGLKIPVEYKIKDGTRKHVLRESARVLGLPEEIVVREKKAAQYGSGIMKVMKKLAARENLTLKEYLEKF